MSKYKIVSSSSFKRDVRRLVQRGYDITRMKVVVRQLADGETLPAQNKDHPLRGRWAKYRECHITPDWVLVYKIETDILSLVLSRTGTHADLFNL